MLRAPRARPSRRRRSRQTAARPRRSTRCAAAVRRRTRSDRRAAGADVPRCPRVRTCSARPRRRPGRTAPTRRTRAAATCGRGSPSQPLKSPTTLDAPRVRRPHGERRPGHAVEGTHVRAHHVVEPEVGALTQEIGVEVAQDRLVRRVHVRHLSQGDIPVQSEAFTVKSRPTAGCWRRLVLGDLLDELCDQRRPAGLMRGTQTLAPCRR